LVGASAGSFLGKLRGISTMHTDTDFSKAPEGVISQPRQARGWLQWLFPRPFYLISSAIYLCVFGGFLYTFATVLFQSQACGCQPEWVRLLLMTCAIAALFALDRLEYRLYGEETPRRAAIVLFLARVLVYEVVAASDYYQYSPMLTLFLPLLGILVLWQPGRLWIGGAGLCGLCDPPGGEYAGVFEQSSDRPQTSCSCWHCSTMASKKRRKMLTP
jgi:hypothetical protein